MPSSITINGITGTSPYNITLCDTDPVSPTCVWIAQITDLDLPYTFTPPISLQYTTSFLVKIVDSGFPCTIITPPILRTLNPCYPVYVDATNNEVYSFDPSSYGTSSYFDPGVQIDAMTRSDDKLWIFDSSQGWIYEYDTTGYTTPTIIRQIDTTYNSIDIYGMCVYSSTELLALSSTGDVNIINISTNTASVTGLPLYNIGGTPQNDCNLLRDDNIGITYMKTSLTGLKAFYDDGTQYSTATWPSGNQKGLFRDSSTAEIYGVNNTGVVYKIPQPPGSVTPSSVTTISPDNLVSGGLGQSNSCIPPVSSFKMSINMLNTTPGQNVAAFGFSSDTFSWINWGDTNKISGGSGNFGFNIHGGSKSHEYTSPYVGDVTFYSYDNFIGFKKLVISFGALYSALTGNMYTYELHKISGLTEFWNYGFGNAYLYQTNLIGYVTGFPQNLKILYSGRSYLTGNTSDFTSSLEEIYLGFFYLQNKIYGNFNSLPINLKSFYMNGTTSSLSGTSLGLPRNLTYLNLEGGNKLSGSTYDLPSGLTYVFLQDANTIYDSTYGLPSGLTQLIVYGFNTISDNTLGLPRYLNYLDIKGYNIISGDTSGIPSGLTFNSIQGYNTVSGDTTGLPISATTYIFGNNTISGNISGLPSHSRLVWIFGNNTISGDTSGLPGYINDLNISQQSVFDTTGNTISGNISGLTGSTLSKINIAGANTISGDTTDIPTTATFTELTLYGLNTLSGDIANIPPNIHKFTVYGNNQLSGDISGLPTSTLNTFSVGGNNTISGGFSGFPTSSGIQFFTLIGGNIDYTPGSASGMGLPNGISQFTFTPGGSVGSALSSADVDSIIFAATGITWAGSNRILSIRGGNSSPTVASFPARQQLSGGSFNVQVYTN